MKILIYRGETLQGQYDLGAQPLRIGRSPENDIVLEDPGKGVSRHHAEIRPEEGGYSLVDLESQNGIWVHGSRVPSVRLEPGVAAALGPYRLTVPEEVVTAAMPPVQQEPPIDPTEYARPIDPRVLTAAGRMLDPAAETGPVEAILPVAPPAPAPEQPSAGSTVRPAREGSASTVRPASKPPGTKSKAPLVAAATVLVIGGAAIAAYQLVLHKPAPKPVWSRDVATALVNQGRCQDALQQQIGPALAANPNDPDALALKAQCAPRAAPAPVAPPAPAVAAAPPPPDPTAQALDAVDASLASSNCQAALDAVTTVLATAPDNPRAHDLQTRAQDCVKATVRLKPATPTVATAIPPAQGGLDVQPGETPQAYKARVQKMKDRYQAAVALLQPQHYRQALTELDAIAALVPAGYMDLTQRRAAAHDALHAESAREYAAGQSAEQSQDFATALQHYQRAHDLEASHDVSQDIARVNDLKTRLGHDACSSGDAYFIENRNVDAAAQYTKVVQFLSDPDPCYARAKERLAIIHR